MFEKPAYVVDRFIGGKAEGFAGLRSKRNRITVPRKDEDGQTEPVF